MFAATTTGWLQLALQALVLTVIVALALRFMRPKGPAEVSVRLTGVAEPIRAQIMKAQQNKDRLLRVARDLDHPTARMLFIDDVLQGYNDLDDPTQLTFAYTQLFGAVADCVKPGEEALRVLHIGGGPCTLPRYIAATRAQPLQVVLEIDQLVAQWAVEYLDAPEALTYRFGDAAETIFEVPNASCDLAFGDVYGGAQRSPAGVRSDDFIREVRRVLAPEGVYVANVIDKRPFKALRSDMAAFARHFDEVLVLWPRTNGGSIDGGSFVVIAGAGLDRRALSDSIRQHGTLADIHEPLAFEGFG